MPGSLIVDVDTGTDDALALGYLTSRSPNLLAVTTVAGNVPIDYSTANSLRILSWLGHSGVPVHRGASRPLAVDYLDAAHVHGGNGLGNAEFPEADVPASDVNAAEAILRQAEEHAGDLTVLTLGPMTNLAIALSLRPSLVDQVSCVVVMGGAFFNPGNITPHAEFNVYADPHAAQQVFHAGWKELRVLGLDVTHQTIISRSTWAGIADDASRAAQMTKRILARSFHERNLNGAYLHDPLAALATIDPGIIQCRRGQIEVTVDGPERGRTRLIPDSETTQVAQSVRASEAEQAICSALDIVWKPHDTETITSE